MLTDVGNLQYFFLTQYRYEYPTRFRFLWRVCFFGWWACFFNVWLVKLYCLLTGMLVVGCFFVLVEWLAYRLVCITIVLLVDCSTWWLFFVTYGWLVGWSFGLLVSLQWMAGWFIKVCVMDGWLVGCSACWLVCIMVGWWVFWSLSAYWEVCAMDCWLTY